MVDLGAQVIAHDWTMLSGRVNYLDEYRQKYGGLHAPPKHETTDQNTVQSVADVSALLARYLSTEVTTDLPTTLLQTPVANSITEAHEFMFEAVGYEDIGLDDTNETEALLATTSFPDQPSVTTDRVIPGAHHSSYSTERLDERSEEEESPSPEDFDDPFLDDIEECVLLPTTTFSNHQSLTVNTILNEDSQLSQPTGTNIQRSHSNPLENRKERGNASRRTRHSLRSRTDEGQAPGPVDKSRSTSELGSFGSSRGRRNLNRHDSSLSNRSVESNTSRDSQSKEIDILEFSDEDLELEFGEAFEGPKGEDDELLSNCSQSISSEYDCVDATNSKELCSRCNPATPPMALDQVCLKCLRRQAEHLKIVQEMIDSEESYKKDLVLIKEQFIDPLAEAELITAEESSVVFGNLPQLISVSEKFTEGMKAHVTSSCNGNQDQASNQIGQTVCNSSAMFLAFELYCVNHKNALTLLEQLRKERELFSLFLDVSQKDNLLLRRMDVKTFLMIPIQRVMKYPLLLQRLQKATHRSHPDAKNIETAIRKLTNILHHINTQFKQVSGVTSPGKEVQSGKKRTSFEIALTKLCLDTMKWRHHEIHLLITGKIGYLLPTDNLDRLKNQRFNTAYAVIVSNGRRAVPTTRGSDLFFRQESDITSAALIIIKKGSTRLQLLREPFYLRDCIVTRHFEFYDTFEIQEKVKDSFIIRPVHNTDSWFSHLKYLSLVLGGRNQQRRSALPNFLLYS